jgi:hypothetical protein
MRYISNSLFLVIGFLSSYLVMEAERCRSVTAADDSVTEIDGNTNHKKPPRKARKKLLVSQDSILSSGKGHSRQSLPQRVCKISCQQPNFRSKWLCRRQSPVTLDVYASRDICAILWMGLETGVALTSF